MDLVHLIYCSTAAHALSKKECKALLDTSWRHNGENGITGILLYMDGYFFQVLEGERAEVEKLFEKISADPRHHRVTRIILEPIAQRDFGVWSMGYPEMTADELAAIPGLNDFFTQGTLQDTLQAGRTKTLLSAFKEKSWHATPETSGRRYSSHG